MIKADLYNFDGKKKESVNLPKELDVIPNVSLLSQAIHVYEDRSHFGLARTKTRSEVAISTKKIYRQKGTGGARHGAKSAPIFVGGGTAHGPKGMKRILHLSASQRSNALVHALKYKASDSLVVLVDGIEKIRKTKEAGKLIDTIVSERKWIGKNILLALSGKNKDVFKAFRNIEGLAIENYRNLNAYSVFLAGGIVIDKEALEEKRNDVEVVKKNAKKDKTNMKVSVKTNKTKSVKAANRKAAVSKTKTGKSNK